MSKVDKHNEKKRNKTMGQFRGFRRKVFFEIDGFWVYPLLTLALGSLVNYLSLLTYPPGVRLVGSSGLVYLMAGFWLTMYILVERRITLGRRLLHGLGVGLIVLMPSAFQATVSYRTHAFGLAIGIVSAMAYFLFWKPAIRAAEEVEYREEDELL